MCSSKVETIIYFKTLKFRSLLKMEFVVKGPMIYYIYKTLLWSLDKGL